MDHDGSCGGRFCADLLCGPDTVSFLIFSCFYLIAKSRSALRRYDGMNGRMCRDVSMVDDMGSTVDCRWPIVDELLIDALCYEWMVTPFFIYCFVLSRWFESDSGCLSICNAVPLVNVQRVSPLRVSSYFTLFSFSRPSPSFCASGLAVDCSLCPPIYIYSLQCLSISSIHFNSCSI